MSQPRTFFVTGATGNQGGAVARALLAAGHYTNCLVRDPNSPSAQALQSAGAHLVKGEFTDSSALKAAATGCTGVFINVVATKEAGAELENALNIIAASVQAGVSHCIFASVVNAGKHEGFKNWSPTTFRAGYWLTKAAIQDAVKNAGFASYTILQPGGLMTNFVAPISQWYYTTLAADHTLRTAYKPSTRLPLTDPEDIGKFAAYAFVVSPSIFHNATLPVASQMATAAEMAATMSEVSGVEVKAEFMPSEEIEEKKATNALVASQVWASDGWNEINIAEVEKYGVKTGSFRDFLVREKEALDKALKA